MKRDLKGDGMGIDMKDMIINIPVSWKVAKIKDMEVYVTIDGKEHRFPMDNFSESGLKQLRARWLGQMKALLMQRSTIYKYIEVVNSELEKREG